MKKLNLFLYIALFCFSSYTMAKPLIIGTVAYRGVEQAHNRWDKTIEYLQTALPDQDFILKPLTLTQLEEQVTTHQLDFLLGNPGLYYTLKHTGLEPISSLINKRNGKGYDQFGAIIFTRADNKNINTITDLKNKTLGAVSIKAFGGFQMSWRELKSHGIDPFTDLKDIKFIGFPMDNVVYQVRDGQLDAGTVRTDLLERMNNTGLIKLSDYKVLHPRYYHDFPFQVSTRLYPDWIISKAQKTSTIVANQVQAALLKLSKDHPAALAGNYIGWTHKNRMDELLLMSISELSEVNVSEDRYISIDQMMKELEIGPYKH